MQANFTPKSFYFAVPHISFMRNFSLLLFISIIVLSCSRQQIIHPQYKNIVEAVYASGTILPENEYKVFALSNGVITEKRVKDGDSVKAGDVLYVVSNQAASAQLQTAKAAYQNALSDLSENSHVLNDLKLQMKNAKAKFENDSVTFMRDSVLYFGSSVGTKANYDQAQMAYMISRNQKKSAEEKFYSAQDQLRLALNSAKSQLASAEEMLGNYTIRSDSNGTVFQTFKEEGEAVHSGELIALLGKKSKRIIRLAVDQQDIDKVKIGQQVLLKTDVTANKIYNATITRIYPVMNEADQTFRVDAAFPDSVIMPYVHSSVEANIVIQKKEHALVIPRSALIAGDSVMVDVSGKKKIVQAKTGIVTLDDAEIISGIDEKSNVILPEKK